jgi:DtxR family transcriptional regulator, Mn-dependent transcriptional regulator
MEAARPTPTIEDYLGVIYTLERDGEPVIGARLAEWMEVSPPTVTATVKRMIRDGWVTTDERRGIHLTAAGRKAAASVVRRHMLTELLLARVLEVPWSEVHQEADQMEHTISGETMQRLVDRLDDPQTCPHGNPLPGHEALLQQWVALTAAEPGQRILIQRVHESAEQNRELMVFLEAHSVMPGTEARVEQVADFNRTVSLRVGEETVVLGFPVAECIYIEVLGGP